MHASTSRRSTAGSRPPSRAVRRRRLADDTDATFAGAVLPALLGIVGLVSISAGAFLGLIPLLLTGVGLCAVGFTSFLIAEKVRRDQVRTRARQTDAKRARHEEATLSEGSDARRGGAPLPPRSPLADAAVEALTGDGSEGGVWPPIGARGRQGAKARGVDHWSPDAPVGPEAFAADARRAPVEAPAGAEDAIRFEAVPMGSRGSPHAVAHGDASTGAAPPRVPMAEPDPVPRDFRVWPGNKDLAGWDRFSDSGGPRASQVDPEAVRARMKERRQKMAEGLPLVGAMLADEGDAEKRPAAFADKTRGKCSRCTAVIWAPKRRPIVLKCPSCGHKAKLY